MDIRPPMFYLKAAAIVSNATREAEAKASSICHAAHTRILKVRMMLHLVPLVQWFSKQDTENTGEHQGAATPSQGAHKVQTIF